MLLNFNTSDSWTILTPIEASIKAKIEEKGLPLRDWDISIYRGILTGLNEAFIISSEKKDELIAEDPKSAEIIRPILRGRDIKRYNFTFADLWVIIAKFGSYEYLERDYPAIYRHLEQYKDQLQKRGQCRYTSSGKVNPNKPYPGQHHWLELDNNPRDEYLNDFSKQKIVWGNLCLSAQFTLVEDDFLISAPSPMIVPGTKYLLAILNSKLADWYIRQLGVTRNGGYFEYKPMFIEKLPVPISDEKTQQVFNGYIENLLNLKQNNLDTSTLENEIDELVYQLYGLNTTEIQYIENQ